MQLNFLKLLKKKLPLKHSYLIGLVTFLYISFSLVIVGDFSSNWDERHNRNFGFGALSTAIKYLRTGEPAPQRRGEEHGTAYESFLALAEIGLGLDYDREPTSVHLMRHILIHLIFVLGILCFFGLCRAYFRSWLLATLGALMLLLHPRIFNHSFHNSMDIAFLAACSISFYTLFCLQKKRVYWLAILHGFTVAFATDIRITAVMIVAITLMGLAFDLFANFKNKETRNRLIILTGVFCFSWSLFTVLMWPFLWGAPVSNFIYALQSMSNIAGGGPNIYMTKVFSTNNLPWHYNPVWITLTTPALILLLSVTGILAKTFTLFRRPADLIKNDFTACAVFCWFSIPIIFPMIFKTPLFDSWRHHFFVYPGLVFFAIVGLNFVVKNAKKFRPACSKHLPAVVAGVIIIHCSWINYSLHPYQNLYFNFLQDTIFGPQNGLTHHFAMDYWGLSYRDGLEYLAKNTTGEITVNSYPPTRINWVWLEKKDRDRIKFIHRNDSQYFMGTYRNRIGEYPKKKYGKEIFEKKVNGIKILSVRKQKPPKKKNGIKILSVRKQKPPEKKEE